MPLLALPFPAIDPVLVEFGPFAIRWYALAYISGLVFGWWYIRRTVATERLWSPGQARPDALAIDDLLVWMTFGVILGGRLGYVLFYNFGSYLNDPLEALAIWRGGMSIHGGFVGCALAQAIFARRIGVPTLTLFDLTTASVPVGLFLGRLANFVNGELYGRPTDVPWAFVFPAGGPLPRHPSQLYEAVLEGLLLMLVLTPLVWRRGALMRPGLVAGLFGIGYALSRIAVEFVREPDEQLGTIAFGFLTMGMALSIVMLAVALVLVAAAASGRTRADARAAA